MRLVLTFLATAWIVVVAVAYFWVGFAFVTPFGPDATDPYWIIAWLLFAAVAAVPFIAYSALVDY